MGAAGETVGSDRFVVKGDTVVLYAACRMLDWKTTRYRKTAVVWRDRTYFVESQGPVTGAGWRYVLAPWPEDLHDTPGRVVHYDARYVQERDALRREQQALERSAVGLWAISPLLGFLPSRVKLRLNERYGFHPVTVTDRSLLLEYAILVVLLGAFVIFAMASGLAPVYGADGRRVGGPSLVGLFLAAAFLAVDRIVRYDRLLTASMQQYGLGEWLVRRLDPDP
jgi:hypothetical protein